MLVAKPYYINTKNAVQEHLEGGKVHCGQSGIEHPHNAR
jgi:hypothetical protein